jgi:hypothetical protein
VRTTDFSNEQPTYRRPHSVAPALATVRLILAYPIAATPIPGSDNGLSIIIRDCMKVLRRAGVHCEVWGVKNAEDLMCRMEREEYRYDRKITHVVINPPLGYDHPDMFQKLSARWVDAEFVQLNHSGLSYISINENAFIVIRDLLNLEIATHNVIVAGNNLRYTKWIGDTFGKDALYLPNLYDTESYVNPVVARQDYDPLRIGSFGEARPWKNQLIAAESALALARRLGVNLELWVNRERAPNSWNGQARSRAQLFAGLRNAKLVTIPWDAWPKFRKAVAAVDIMFSPSFDETFCCVCADGIAEGIPSVVTGAMEWCPRSWMATEDWDPASVSAVGLSLLHDKRGAVHDGRRALDAYVKNGLQLWIEYLTR